MANIPDINVDVASPITIDTSTTPITVEAVLQSPTISVTNTNGTIAISADPAPDIAITESAGATITTAFDNVTINVDVNGVPGPPGPPGTGGGTEKDFSTVVLNLNVPSGQGEYTLTSTKQFFILGYTATVAGIRIRGYADTAHRTYDAARPVTEEPLMNGGVLFELVTEIGTYKFSKMVPVYAETSMPLLVESVNGSPIDTSVILSLF